MLTNMMDVDDRFRKKKSVGELLRRNMLVSPEFLELIENMVPEELAAAADYLSEKILVMNKDAGQLFKKKELNINWLELERAKALSEKRQNPGAYSNFLEALFAQQDFTSNNMTLGVDQAPVKVVFSYNAAPSKREVADFVSYYGARYKSIQGLLLQRAELHNLVQIDRIKGAGTSESYSVIGMVREKRQTKYGNLILTIEDPTGSIDAVVDKSRRELLELAHDTVFDEVVAVIGSLRNGALFATNILLPDVPLREPKHGPEESYALFMSDLHFGSAQFLEEDFTRFIKWIKGNLGNSTQKDIATKVKYILIAGDVVDGVGVYQDQYDELSLKDVKEQYKMCAEFLSQIPEHIKIVISPGNHDAVRAAEPQAELSDDFAAPLLELPNVIPVSNPAVVNIGASANFQGFDVLLYHGYSFDYYVANVDSIRRQGGYERADLIMKFLLQRRHLAPAHTSTLILPDQTVDPLFIDIVPDIFATGHIHRTSVSDYKGVALINSSCWQGKTKFQERLGHNPQPSRVPVFNLKTRAIKIINFGK